MLVNTMDRSVFSDVRRMGAAVAFSVALIAGGLALGTPVQAWAEEGDGTPANQEPAPAPAKNGWVDGVYYEDDAAVSGAKTIDGKHYFLESGKPVNGIRTVSGKKYFFDGMGGYKTGIQYSGGKYYRFASDGALNTASGYAKSGSKKFYFKSGVASKGVYTVSGKKYYFTGKGGLYTGMRKVSGKYYYFKKSSGAMYKNGIAGKYYYGKDGVRCTATSIKYAVKFVNSHTKKSWSKSKKLRTCYYQFGKAYRNGFGNAYPSRSQLAGFATYSLKTGYGNCYRFACGYATIARVLGYDSGVGIGRTNGAYGAAPHGWTLVKVGGKYCAYDVDARVETGYGFKKNAAGHPWGGLRPAYKCYLKVKNGKVSW